MLHTYPRRSDDDGDFAGCRWVDLLSPTDEEVARVTRAFGIDVPSEAALEEIESTSRLRSNGDTLYLSAPLFSAGPDGQWEIAPTGIILSPEVCVTVRFAEMKAFDAVIADFDRRGGAVDAAEIMVRLLEEVVDRAADHLERASQAVTETAREIFADDAFDRRRRLSHDTARLRTRMKLAGRVSERIAQVRYTFLSIGRIAGYIKDHCTPKISGPLRERLTAVEKDIVSLDEFEDSLSNRIQLIQNAATGFISIGQNDVVKVLTIASTVGVPPLFVVGVYGMNFRYMPELEWPHGYPMALLLALVSALLPLIWFKWRDWI